MIRKAVLHNLYCRKGKSMHDIAIRLNCSVSQVIYWMKKYKMKRRNWSEATYAKRNPNGDPFKFHAPKTSEDYKLMGLGIGLYWGEGTKANLSSIRLGNTNPQLINYFILFLIRIMGVKKQDLHFGLQVFSDVDPEEALDFWAQSLKVKKSQFQKVIITLSGSIGTYRKKSKYGVLTVYYNNKKARDLLVSMLPM